MKIYLGVVVRGEARARLAKTDGPNAVSGIFSASMAFGGSSFEEHNVNLLFVASSFLVVMDVTATVIFFGGMVTTRHTMRNILLFENEFIIIK